MSGLIFNVQTATADQPIGVDCDLLADTILAVDDFLDANGIQNDSLGDLVSDAILDEAVFQQLNFLISNFSTAISGGETTISFDSASQTLTTIAKCRLIPLLNESIAD